MGLNRQESRTRACHTANVAQILGPEHSHPPRCSDDLSRGRPRARNNKKSKLKTSKNKHQKNKKQLRSNFDSRGDVLDLFPYFGL